MPRELIRSYPVARDEAHVQGDTIRVQVRDGALHLTVKDFPFLEERTSGDRTQPYAVVTQHHETALVVPDGGGIEIELADGTVSIYRRSPE